MNRMFPAAPVAALVAQHLARFEPIAIYGFGSFFADTARDDSDIDLAFWSDRAASPLEIYRTAGELSVVLGRDVHLIDLTSADAVIRAQVIGTGALLACSDEAARARVEMYALSDYARLNEERREILQRIEKEGSVFGG